jgi:hypothetical protein
MNPLRTTVLMKTDIMQWPARPRRTRTITDAFILFSDLSGFGRMLDAGPASATVERILDALDALACDGVPNSALRTKTPQAMRASLLASTNAGFHADQARRIDTMVP